jgi:hypothetical protein
MQRIQPLAGFDQIKLLADARRLKILRLLMAGPLTLSQLARTSGIPGLGRHHLPRAGIRGLTGWAASARPAGG